MLKFKFPDRCKSVKCLFGGRCEEGECICGSEHCPEVYEPVCASNGKIVMLYIFLRENILTVSHFSPQYFNHCFLELDNCRRQRSLDFSELRVVESGACEPRCPEGESSSSSSRLLCRCPDGVAGPDCDRCTVGHWAYTSFGCRGEETKHFSRKKKSKTCFFCHFQSATATRWAPSPPLATRRRAAASASLATRGSSARSAPMARWRTSPSVSEVRSLRCYYKLLCFFWSPVLLAFFLQIH